MSFEETTTIFLGVGRVEHDEEGGGVGLGIGDGVRMSGGLNGEDTGSSEGFGLGIDGAGAGSGGGADKDANTTPTSSPKKSPTKAERGLRSKKRAESLAAGDGDGEAVRSRFGGFGGRKLRSRRASTVESMGGVPMERTVSSRGSRPLSLGSASGASYRGADMEMGGGGLGLGLGLGFSAGDVGVGSGVEDSKEGGSGNLGLGLGLGLGFGGVPMKREGGKTAVGGYGRTHSLPTRRRTQSISKIGSVNTTEMDSPSDETQESVTAQFLDF